MISAPYYLWKRGSRPQESCPVGGVPKDKPVSPDLRGLCPNAIGEGVHAAACSANLFSSIILKGAQANSATQVSESGLLSWTAKHIHTNMLRCTLEKLRMENEQSTKNA